MGVRRRAVSLHGDELSFWEAGPGDAAGADADHDRGVVVLVHGVASRG